MKYHVITVALFVAALVLYMASSTEVGTNLGAVLFCAGVVFEISFWIRGIRGKPVVNKMDR